MYRIFGITNAPDSQMMFAWRDYHSHAEAVQDGGRWQKIVARSRVKKSS